MDSDTLTIRIDKKLKQQVREKARETYRSVTSYVTRALAEQLKRDRKP